MLEPAEPPTAPHDSAGPRGRYARPLRLAVAMAALSLAALAVAGYPLMPGLLAAGLLLYAAVLWRWPVAWLVVVPAVLPSFDLAPWTGWSMVEESDLVVLVTVAVLALRAPPRRGDFTFSGLAGAALALAVLCCVISVVRGLVLPGPPEGSDIAELRPDNALRVAKGFAVALALLPFLRHAIATRGDAARLFAGGMAAGLTLVGIAALYERLLFPGGLDFVGNYRIVATFSSMHFGGGYVGAYAAMALPFALSLLVRGGRRGAAVLAGTVVLGIYTLVVTFARAAYGATVAGCAVLALCWARRRAPGASTAVPLSLLAAAVAVVVWAATASDIMSERLGDTMPDLASREALWAQGLSLRPPGAATFLFGMGLGTYARSTLAAVPPADGPGNVVLKTEGGRRFARIEAGLPLYLIQKVRILPGRTYRLSFWFRSADADSAVVALLCENAMLYAGRCRDLVASPHEPGTWEQVDGTIASRNVARGTRFGLLRRPTILAFFVPNGGGAADIADIRLDDPSGRELIANGDFAQGHARWFLIDDEHTMWRIENQYLMTLFEEGALGVAALLLFGAVALGGAIAAVPKGDPLLPAYAAALAAFLSSCVFDCPLEVPRLAALFYLIAFAAMALREKTRA
jgi:O-antigen ligase